MNLGGIQLRSVDQANEPKHGFLRQRVSSSSRYVFQPQGDRVSLVIICRRSSDMNSTGPVESQNVSRRVFRDGLGSWLFSFSSSSILPPNGKIFFLR
jgi:hypothetical protein